MDILITAAIISLLSSLFLFRISEAKKKAEDGQMKVQAHEVSNAIALYKNDNGGRAPLTAVGGGGPGTPGVMHAEDNPDSDYLPTMQTLVDGGYLSQIPTSPDGSSYYYGVSENYEDAVFLADLNNPLASNLSSGDSCRFLPEESSQQMICTTTPAQPATCSVVPAVIQTYCPEVGNCYDVLVSATTTSCTPEIPAQTICPDSGPQFQASLCDGSDENNLCQCI